MKAQTIFELISKEETRQRKGIELIASENFTSLAVLEAMGSCLTNKYAEGYPGKRYYGGCEVVDEVETIAINSLKDLFSAEYANVQPHSGAQANSAVYLAVIKPGDTILGLNLAHGGHLTHGSPVNYSGLTFNAVPYNVHPETGRVDMDQVYSQAKAHLPKLIICGASAYSRDWDYKRFREIADEVGALLMCDMAHPAGLISAGLLNDPLQHCHIVTSTTHKTLRGPRGGVILMGHDFPNPWGRTTKKGEPIMMSAILNSGVFPGMQGGPLEHVIAAKAVSFLEASTTDFKTYSKQVIVNAQAMSGAFTELGYNIVSGGTDNHLMLIDLSNKGITGKEAEEALIQADITVNKNMVPFDKTSPYVTSGIRVGTPAITTRGMNEADCVQIVQWMDEALQKRNDPAGLRTLHHTINQFASSFRLYPDETEANKY